MNTTTIKYINGYKPLFILENDAEKFTIKELSAFCNEFKISHSGNKDKIVKNILEFNQKMIDRTNTVVVEDIKENVELDEKDIINDEFDVKDKDEEEDIIDIDISAVNKNPKRFLKYKGIYIESREEDNFVNATQMCKAGGKKINHWLDLESTKNLINALETKLNSKNNVNNSETETSNKKSDTGIPVSQNDYTGSNRVKVIEIFKGNSSKFSQGVWIHYKLAVPLACWIDSDFSLEVSDWTFELLTTGSVSIKPQKQLTSETQSKMVIKTSNLNFEAKELGDKIDISKTVNQGGYLYMILVSDRLVKMGYASIYGERIEQHNKDKSYKFCIPFYVKKDVNQSTERSIHKTLLKYKTEDIEHQREIYFIPKDKELKWFIELVENVIDELTVNDTKIDELETIVVELNKTLYDIKYEKILKELENEKLNTILALKDNEILRKELKIQEMEFLLKGGSYLSNNISVSTLQPPVIQQSITKPIIESNIPMIIQPIAKPIVESNIPMIIQPVVQQITKPIVDLNIPMIIQQPIAKPIVDLNIPMVIQQPIAKPIVDLNIPMVIQPVIQQPSQNHEQQLFVEPPQRIEIIEQKEEKKEPIKHFTKSFAGLNKKKIFVYNKEGLHIKTFDTLKDAAKELKVSAETIRKHMISGEKYNGNYYRSDKEVIRYGKRKVKK